MHRLVSVIAAIGLSTLLHAAGNVRLPRFPSIRRDLSLSLGESTRYEQVESLIRGVRPEHLEDVEYVTTYRGKPLEKGQKSVTTTLVFRSPTATLTSEEVEGSVQRVMQEAKKQLNASVRM